MSDLRLEVKTQWGWLEDRFDWSLLNHDGDILESGVFTTDAGRSEPLLEILWPVLEGYGVEKLTSTPNFMEKELVVNLQRSLNGS